MLPLLAVLTAGGATHWSYRPLADVSPPVVKAAGEARNAVDRFLLRRLEAAGLSFAPNASREVLIRRLYLDLVGLPPSPSEVAAFTADVRPDAEARLIDRLLASPQFGERFGRHWLDAAGYVDVRGTDVDALPYLPSDGKWHYRDYVVRSWNADKPLDLFLREQIAGDELVAWRSATNFTPANTEPLIATGFLLTTADETSADELNSSDWRHRVLQGTTEILAENLFGMTLRCAKCHDHKYEPLTQRDYYSLVSFFGAALNPDNWLQPQQRELADIPLGERAEIDAFNRPLEKQIEKLRQRRKAAAENDASKRRLKRFDERIAEIEQRKRRYGHFQAMYDVGPAPQMRVLRRGDINAPGTPVVPALPAVLARNEAEHWRGPGGARTALASALTERGSPAAALIARVQVNRVWQHLFGVGLVATADNFGVTGEEPSHPELLDWLAARFVADGSRFKPLIRRLVSSAAYRQSTVSARARRGLTVDPDNRLLWRMPLRRLESEAIRDSLLALSGRIDLTMGGAPVMTRYHKDGRITVDERKFAGTTNGYRRTIYLFARRNYHPTLLTQFDQPILTTICARRTTSATVTQSLAMLNDESVVERSREIARRVGVATRSPDADEWLDYSWRLVLGREPVAAESKWTRRLFDRHVQRYLDQDLPWTEAAPKALAHVCHMLLNTSEFLHRH